VKVYTHKGIVFEWHGKLNIYLPGALLPLPIRQCNGVAYWQIAKGVRLSVNQLKKYLKNVQ
jgi:hypothetical protein